MNSRAYRYLVFFPMLLLTSVSSAQGRYLSFMGGAGARLYPRGTGMGLETTAGIRYGQDLGPVVRLTFGLEHGWTDHTINNTWPGFSPRVESAITLKGRELRGVAGLAIRLNSSEGREWRALVGAELGEVYRLHAQRRLSGPIEETSEVTFDDPSRAWGFRLGLRHARIMKGSLWAFAEPWIGWSMQKDEQAVALPMSWSDNEGYRFFPMRKATIGLSLGLEFGPRTAPRPE